MLKTFLFTDAATSSQAGISIGLFLLLDQDQLTALADFSMDDLSTRLSDNVVYKQYESKKSTETEIRIVIDALHTLSKNVEHPIEIYTDCQSLCDLMTRRKEKLEKSCFITRTGKMLAHAALYKELFAVTKNFRITLIKVKGHAPAHQRLTIQEKIFTLLDKLCRKKLRIILR